MGRIPRRLPAVATGLALLVLALAPASAPAALTWRGVQLHSLWDTPEPLFGTELDFAKLAGSNVVRVDVSWSSLEIHGKGAWSDSYVEKLDGFMAAARDRGMKVIATLWSTPCWASAAPESLKQGCRGAWWDRGVIQYPPRNPWDYADAALWLTARYGDDLAALEVWNEPNLPAFLRSADPVGDYATILRVTYPAAKLGNFSVPVIAGALAGADRPFLEALYADGIRGSYDGLSLHPYNDWRDPSDPGKGVDPRDTFLPGLKWIRSAQRAAGDSTPLWVTEFGWATCAAGSDARCVSEKQQADYLFQGIRLLDGIPWVTAASVYNLRDKGTDPGSAEENFGLVNRDFSPKLGWFGVNAAFRSSGTAR